jgi:hypothetical protein
MAHNTEINESYTKPSWSGYSSLFSMGYSFYIASKEKTISQYEQSTVI